MKRSVSNRRRVRPAGSGIMLAGLLALVPAAVHAQTAPAPQNPPATTEEVTGEEARPAPPARPPATHPVPPPRTSAAPPAPARAYPPPPPRGYPPPPPRYQNYQGYPQQQNAWQGNVNQGRAPYGYYMPPEDMRGAVYRPFSFAFSIGPGALVGPGESELALTYVLRFGIGLAPNLSLVLGFEGAGTNSVNPDSGLDSWLKQETFLIGVQYHFVRGLYVRGAVGEGSISETTDYDRYSGGSGVALSGAIGYEFLQSQHVSLALDLNGSTTRYARESWETAGLNLAVSFF
jgi:hypothetical protein